MAVAPLDGVDGNLSWLRSWVQILPPGPSFPVIELWEQVAGCSKKFSPHYLGCICM